jgi:hypothetical protein
MRHGAEVLPEEVGLVVTVSETESRDSAMRSPQQTHLETDKEDCQHPSAQTLPPAGCLSSAGGFPSPIDLALAAPP